MIQSNQKARWLNQYDFSRYAHHLLHSQAVTLQASTGRRLIGVDGHRPRFGVREPGGMPMRLTNVAPKKTLRRTCGGVSNLFLSDFDYYGNDGWNRRASHSRVIVSSKNHVGFSKADELQPATKMAVSSVCTTTPEFTPPPPPPASGRPVYGVSSGDEKKAQLEKRAMSEAFNMGTQQEDQDNLGLGDPKTLDIDSTKTVVEDAARELSALSHCPAKLSETASNNVKNDNKSTAATATTAGSKHENRWTQAEPLSAPHDPRDVFGFADNAQGTNPCVEVSSTSRDSPAALETPGERAKGGKEGQGQLMRKKRSVKFCLVIEVYLIPQAKEYSEM